MPVNKVAGGVAPDSDNDKKDDAVDDGEFLEWLDDTSMLIKWIDDSDKCVGWADVDERLPEWAGRVGICSVEWPE